MLSCVSSAFRCHHFSKMAWGITPFKLTAGCSINCIYFNWVKSYLYISDSWLIVCIANLSYSYHRNRNNIWNPLLLPEEKHTVFFGIPFCHLWYRCPRRGEDATAVSRRQWQQVHSTGGGRAGLRHQGGSYCMVAEQDKRQATEWRCEKKNSCTPVFVSFVYHLHFMFLILYICQVLSYWWSGWTLELGVRRRKTPTYSWWGHHGRGCSLVLRRRVSSRNTMMDPWEVSPVATNTTSQALKVKLGEIVLFWIFLLHNKILLKPTIMFFVERLDWTALWIFWCSIWFYPTWLYLPWLKQHRWLAIAPLHTEHFYTDLI